MHTHISEENELDTGIIISRHAVRCMADSAWTQKEMGGGTSSTAANKQSSKAADRRYYPIIIVMNETHRPQHVDRSTVLVLDSGL